ncbi:hypothetical protein Tco_0942757 [Tanacetum coccineum]
MRRLKKLEDKLMKEEETVRKLSMQQGQDPDVPGGRLQEEQISPSTLEAAQILTNVASEGFKGSQAPLGSKIYRRKPKSKPTPTKILHFEEPDESQVNTGSTLSAQVNTAALNTGETERVQRRKGKDPMTEEDLQAEVQASKKSKELQELADLEEAQRVQAEMDVETQRQINLDALLARRMEQILAEKINKKKGSIIYMRKEAKFLSMTQLLLVPQRKFLGARNKRKSVQEDEGAKKRKYSAQEEEVKSKKGEKHVSSLIREDDDLWTEFEDSNDGMTQSHSGSRKRKKGFEMWLTTKHNNGLFHQCLTDIKNFVKLDQEQHGSLGPTFPIFDNDDDEYTIQYKEYLENSSKAITPDLPTEEPDNSLSMGDEHLSTILETESDEVIKSCVEDLIPIPSEFEVEASPPDSEFVILEEMKDDILHEKLLNINHLVAKIEALNDNPTPNCVLKSPSPFPIPVEDSDSFFKKSDTSLSYSDNSLPEFKTFSYHMEELGELTRVVVEDISDNSTRELRVYVPNILPTHLTLYLDSDFFLSDDSLRSDIEVSFPSRTRNKIFDRGIFFKVQSKRFLSRDTFSILFIHNHLCPVIETLLPFSFKNEDTFFNPGILSSNLLSHRGKLTSDFSESPMMISRRDIPFLDVLFLHFYPA